jgi:hypothetical protein
LYLRTLKRLAAKGWNRAPQETAEEYLARVRPSWRAEPRLLESLTAGFVADRYGPRRIDPRELGFGWSELRSTMRKVRRAHGR